jgi:hypothetical protein
MLVAEGKVAQITVRSSELNMGQRKFAVQFDGPFEGWDRFGVFTPAPQFNPQGEVLECLQRCSRRLFNRDIKLLNRSQ